MTQEPYPHPDVSEVTLPEVLHALSDPVRLSILQALVPGQESAWSGFMVSVAPSTLSHHMKVLRNAGLITHRKEGTRCLVSLRQDLGERFPGLLDTVLRLAPVA
ncbi:MAG: helix-turn-helix transcriptional regulator [Proteobacteria bacterium]|nr:helix-turn-helix transcriptional regulator [Pseudomonadota bacterium]